LLFFPTADEDFQYFRSQGYTGSINDMHYKALGDLGYTGSLNDRIHKYLTEEYGSFYEAMRDLRNGTLTFSLSSLSAYAVNNFDPSLVFDFKQNYYRTGGTDSTLSGSVTQTRASSATMTNSSGTLITVGNNVPRTDHYIYNGSAWVNEGILHESEARTNILTYSSMESTGWTFQSGSRSATTWVLTGASDATTITASTSTGGNGNRIYKTGIAGGTGVTCSISFYYKANTTVPFLHIRSNNGSGGPGVGACINTATGAGVYLNEIAAYYGDLIALMACKHYQIKDFAANPILMAQLTMRKNELDSYLMTGRSWNQNNNVVGTDEATYY